MLIIHFISFLFFLFFFFENIDISNETLSIVVVFVERFLPVGKRIKELFSQKMSHGERRFLHQRQQENKCPLKIFIGHRFEVVTGPKSCENQARKSLTINKFIMVFGENIVIVAKGGVKL